jgi:hypothetical protein
MSPFPRSNPGRLETWLFGAGSLAATLLLAAFFYRTAVLKHLDTAFLFQAVDSILAGQRPLSEVVSSWSQGYRFFLMPPLQVCASALAFVGGAPYDMLGNHAYLGLYPVAALAMLTGTEYAFALLNAAAHLALLALPYWFLRRRGIPVLASLAFSVLVAAYPGWSLSSVGDYYMDRLAMPSLLALLYLLHERARDDARPGSWSWRAIVLVAIAAAICTERAAIMVLGAVLFFLACYAPVRRDPVLCKALLLLAGGLVAYLAWYFALVYVGVAGVGNLARDSVHSVHALLGRLQQPGFWPFLCTNLVFLGWFAIVAGWRTALLTAGALAPNVLVSTGGAELVGWSTHYHTMYIPFLVYAASLGYARAAQRMTARLASAMLAVVVVAAAAVMARHYDPYTARWEKATSSPSGRWGVMGVAMDYFFRPARSSARVASESARGLAEVVPRGSSISAVEGVMPALYAGRRISMYPVGLDSAEYLVVNGTVRDGVVSFQGATSYLGPAEGAALDACLTRRAVQSGFGFVKEVPAIGVIVMRRQQHPPS